MPGGGGGTSCRALPPDFLDLLSMRCISAVLRGEYGKGLRTGVPGVGRGVDSSRVSCRDLLIILSTSTLLRGVYGSGLKTGVCGATAGEELSHSLGGCGRESHHGRRIS